MRKKIHEIRQLQRRGHGEAPARETAQLKEERGSEY